MRHWWKSSQNWCQISSHFHVSISFINFKSLILSLSSRSILMSLNLSPISYSKWFIQKKTSNNNENKTQNQVNRNFRLFWIFIASKKVLKAGQKKIFRGNENSKNVKVFLKKTFMIFLRNKKKKLRPRIGKKIRKNRIDAKIFLGHFRSHKRKKKKLLYV